jgi:hypothetical protein
MASMRSRLAPTPDREVAADAATAGYNPQDTTGGVINASAYRAFMLFDASTRFARPDYRRAAERNLNFVLRSQQPDGSWFYAADGVRDFVDHFHTCFVLKALAKIDGEFPCGLPTRHRRRRGLRAAPLRRARLPNRSHADRDSRFTGARLYDYAECLNLGTLLRAGATRTGRARTRRSSIYSGTGGSLMARSDAPSCSSDGTTCQCIDGRRRRHSGASPVHSPR